MVETCADGINPSVYICEDKEKARALLKKLWSKCLEEAQYGDKDGKNTWCDIEGDFAMITFVESDWVYYQVVKTKTEDDI